MKNAPTQNSTPAILVIFGITGDLATKKIIPSLWRLFQQHLLPDRFSAVGLSRKSFSDAEFEEFVRSVVRGAGGEAVNAESLSRFAALFSHKAGTFEALTVFQEMAEFIRANEARWGVCANKLFYLAAPPPSYGAIFEHLAAVKLNVPCGGELGWSRVLIEKPFGVDLASAKSLQSLLSSYFTEEQIYRIDHYLFKEIIQGIENFRFSNNLFENTWDNTTIDRIDIRLSESIGVEGRGGFYDAVGAFRDVGQNHLLAMLAALLMENPAGENARALRENRSRVMEALLPWSEVSIREQTFRAQYMGYRDTRGVNRDSNTETYFALKTELTDPRWRGVPIFMEAGKRMAEARKEIIVTLKHPEHCLLCEVGPHHANTIAFRLEPNDEIQIRFWTKKPGFERVLEEGSFSFFLYERAVKTQYVEEYAKVLHAAMRGDQESFVSGEEVVAAWQFADPVIKAWSKNAMPLETYAPGSTPSPSFLRPERAGGSRQEASGGTLAVIGLGKMGGNIARRLLSKGWRVVGFNRSPDATRGLLPLGLKGAYSLREAAAALPKPRMMLLMVPAGKAVDEILFGAEGLVHLLDRGDIVIDGGNSFYKDSIARHEKFKAIGVYFADVGISGGPKGALEGASLMLGGDPEVFARLEPLASALAAKDAYRFFEGAGMGHFVKMVHNGIEYGMMQSLAEGFAVMKRYSAKLDLKNAADVYNHNSVIESRLVGWLKSAFEKYGENLDPVSGSVSHTGEGEWTVKIAEELGVPTPVIKASFDFRVASAEKPSYAGKILSALRNQFGGHDIKPREGKKQS